MEESPTTNDRKLTNFGVAPKTLEAQLEFDRSVEAVDSNQCAAFIESRLIGARFYLSEARSRLGDLGLSDGGAFGVLMRIDELNQNPTKDSDQAFATLSMNFVMEIQGLQTRARDKSFNDRDREPIKYILSNLGSANAEIQRCKIPFNKIAQENTPHDLVAESRAALAQTMNK